MKKVLLSLILIFTLGGCTTTNPDGSSTVGMKGSILWIINAPIEYAVEYSVEYPLSMYSTSLCRGGRLLFQTARRPNFESRFWAR